MIKKQYLLMILDGVGINENTEGNALKLANTPNIDDYILKYKNTFLKCSGLDVGLPIGQMGNSEVGHMSIGAGRVVYQDLTKIDKEISNGDFFKNTFLIKAMVNTKINNSNLHIMGLLSDGGVHSHIEHLYAILKLAKEKNVKHVYIHAFLDGRDTPPTSGINYLKQLEEKINELGVGKIVSIVGRYYSMDRDNRYERTKLAYDMLVSGVGTNFKSVQKAIENSYETEEFDEFVKPICILDDNDKTITINNHDSVIFFNFRPDRARQITKAITSNNFNDFERNKVLSDLVFVTMTTYDDNLSVDVAYKKDNIYNTIGEYISRLGYSQLRISETEKYAHVTFFLNGGQEKKYDNESRILVPSPKIATYDLQPEMSANEITENVIEAMVEQEYDLIIMNYANGDMVGHTGSLDKTIEAIEVIDKCVGRVISKLEDIGGEGIITADHGNSEYMIDFKTGEAITSHSNFDVPMIVISDRVKSIENGRLSDIAPTLLKLMNLDKPKEMTGNSLIEI